MKNITHSFYNSINLVYNHQEYHDLEWTSTVTETHDIFEIIYIKKGKVTYVVEGKKYYIENKSIIFTCPGKMHTLFFNDNCIYDRYDIFFDKSIILPDIHKKLFEIPDVITADGELSIGELFKKMDYYFTKFRKKEFGNILAHLVEEIFYNLILLSSENKKTYSANPLIIKAIEYIEKNIGESITLETLCKELYTNKSHLHRLFLNHLGITPKKYVTAKRLEKSQRLLRGGMKPIDVYSICGFSEYSTFWRDYKKHFGYSPSEESGKKIIREILF